MRGAVTAAGKAAREAVASAGRKLGRGWAACLARIFAVDVLKCVRYGGELKPIAAVVEDKELDRLLAYLGVETDFPKTRPALTVAGAGVKLWGARVLDLVVLQPDPDHLQSNPG